MFIYLLLSLPALVNQAFFFVPLFFLVHLYLLKKIWLIPAVVVVSLVGDLFFVWPLGFSGLLFTSFLLLLHLYAEKFNSLNAWFLFLVLGGASIAMFKVANLSFHFASVVVFFGLCLYLSIQIRELHKTQIRQL